MKLICFKILNMSKHYLQIHLKYLGLTKSYTYFESKYYFFISFFHGHIISKHQQQTDFNAS